METKEHYKEEMKKETGSEAKLILGAHRPHEGPWTT